jgi:hypothetical protein
MKERETQEKMAAEMDSVMPEKTTVFYDHRVVHDAHLTPQQAIQGMIPPAQTVPRSATKGACPVLYHSNIFI